MRTGGYRTASGSNRAVTFLFGADPNGLGDLRNEDLAVADLAGFGGLNDGSGLLEQQITRLLNIFLSI